MKPMIRRLGDSDGPDAMLLLCDSFGLDPERTKRLFKDDPLAQAKQQWGAFDGCELISVLTLCPLTFGWGQTAGISGVATRQPRQGEGWATALLDAAVEGAQEQGMDSALLFAHSEQLYRRSGFEPVDEVIRGPLKTSGASPDPVPLSLEQVQAQYENWSGGSPSRLRRDEDRWRSWLWLGRECEAVDGCLFSVEPGTVREAIVPKPLKAWPLPEKTYWVGLRSTAESLQAPLLKSHHELIVMGRNLPARVEMFLTDQF
jgi:GNAT superfamily N-acetyltransferase